MPPFLHKETIPAFPYSHPPHIHKRHFSFWKLSTSASIFFYVGLTILQPRPRGYETTSRSIGFFFLWFLKLKLKEHMCLKQAPWRKPVSNQPILKEINPEYSLEGLMLKLNLQYFGHLRRGANLLEQTLMLGKIEGRRRRGRQMVGWHHWLNGHESEQAPGAGEGQGGLACCSPWRSQRVGQDWVTEQ